MKDEDYDDDESGVDHHVFLFDICALGFPAKASGGSTNVQSKMHWSAPVVSVERPLVRKACLQSGLDCRVTTDMW